MSDTRMPMFGNPVGPWHRWFAWRPVRTYDQRFVWLRPVWRRGIQKHHYLTGGADFWFQYSVEQPERPMPKHAEAPSLAARLLEYRNNPHHINPMSDAFKKLCEDAANELVRLTPPKQGA